MASKGYLPDAQVPISKCKVCDNGVDARFYCQECTQEMCKDCQRMHLRTTSCSNHTVIRIAAEKDTSVHQKETSKLRCQTHLEEAAQMFCLTCTSPVCHTCIADKFHRNHELDKLASIAKTYKEKLCRFKTETKQEIEDLGASLQSIQNSIQDYTTLADKTISDINKQREQIKAEADKVADCLIRELEQCKQRDVKTLKEEGDKIKKRISDDNELLRAYEEKIKFDIDTSVKEFASVLGHKTEKLTMSILPVHPPRYLRYDINDLQDIFGKLEEQKDKTTNVGVLSDRKPITAGTSVNISTDMTSSFELGIYSFFVYAVSDKEAWCGNRFDLDYGLVLVETNGTVKKTVKLDKLPYDITVTKTGDALYTEENTHTIQKYSLDDKVTVIYNTKPYLAQAMCNTADGDLLVCLYNGNRDNKILRMSLNGQTKQTIQYNKKNQPLFSNPTLVTENINGDICVIDYFKNVIVVNKNGRFRFRYPNSSKFSQTIRNCTGIACDKLGYILISDYWSNRIHQIDSDGKFIRLILTKKHGIDRPRGLSIDNKGKLWVCNHDGLEMRIFEYRS